MSDSLLAQLHQTKIPFENAGTEEVISLSIPPLAIASLRAVWRKKTETVYGTRTCSTMLLRYSKSHPLVCSKTDKFLCWMGRQLHTLAPWRSKFDDSYTLWQLGAPISTMVTLWQLRAPDARTVTYFGTLKLRIRRQLHTLAIWSCKFDDNYTLWQLLTHFGDLELQIRR